MRIVLSNSSSRWGGVHKVTELLARQLLARGHAVTVFGYPGGMLEKRIRGIAPFEALLKGMDLHPGTLWRVRQALRRVDPDVVLALMRKDLSLTAPVAYACGVPVVFRHANDRPLRSDPYRRLLYGVFTAFHITNAEATRETLLRSAPWLDGKRVRVVYNGIDSASYENVEPIPIGVPPGNLALGYIGIFEPRKGLRELAIAWPSVAASVPNAHLVLVGKGPMEAELRTMLGDTPRVHWLGYRSDVPSVMRSLDLLVLPSHVEGAPNVVQEAMAAGTAVVATSVSGTPELVRNGIDAWLIPPRDPARLSEVLIDVLMDPDSRRERADTAKQRVRERFGIDQMIDSYEEILSAASSHRV
jgi:glycosyltransferase involved in cell wall biosynthesis